MKIAIAGAGYVGLSLATLLSQKNEVIILDIDINKIEKINKRKSPIKDTYIEKLFAEEKLNLRATSDYKEAFKDARFIIISTPTDYDNITGDFDTSSVEDVIKKALSINVESNLIIKSTIPVGYIKNIRKKYNTDNIIFSPEFLREGKAIYDNLYPTRIIVGEKSEKAQKFANLLKSISLNENVMVKFMDPTEAEAVKLFSNAYLALRVAYFNELDTYAEMKNLNTKDIIDGVCLDPRIGNEYNNPSFGYGGYCLPKDTKQLLANYNGIPQDIIQSIVQSNNTRKLHIVDMIIKESPRIVGIYRLTMKQGSDNFRSSAILDIIKILNKKNIEVIIYEPTFKQKKFKENNVENDLDKFKSTSDIIVANRFDSRLEDVKFKVYTRDIYGKS